jgi:phosphoserine phosphatase
MRPLIVVDLDETLLPFNSFHWWLKLLMSWKGRHIGMKAQAIIGCAAAARGFRLISHGLLKKTVMRVWAKVKKRSARDSDEFASNFARDLVLRSRFSLRRFIEDARATGAQCWLATAAPEDYTSHISKWMEFDLIIATESPRDEGWVECLGVSKRERIAAYRKKMGLENEPLVVVTDHLDDTPVCLMAMYVVWCGSNNDWSKIKSAHPTLKGSLCREGYTTYSEILNVLNRQCNSPNGPSLSLRNGCD